jgi:hypothetical protein
MGWCDLETVIHPGLLELSLPLYKTVSERFEESDLRACTVDKSPVLQDQGITIEGDRGPRTVCIRYIRCVHRKRVMQLQPGN